MRANKKLRQYRKTVRRPEWAHRLPTGSRGHGRMVKQCLPPPSTPLPTERATQSLPCLSRTSKAWAKRKAHDMANERKSIDSEKAKPLGDTGDGDTGVPAAEQGISNRPGDTDDLEDDQAERERQEKLGRDGTGF